MLFTRVVYMWLNRGFGLASRDYFSDPSISRVGRATPGGKQYYANSRFWKTRWEMDRKFTQGTLKM